MKTVQNWLAEYAVSHQNKTNIKIHLVCVPAIFFSIVGLLYCVPLFRAGGANITLAHLVAVFAIIYYLLLSFRLGQRSLSLLFCAYESEALPITTAIRCL